MQQRVGKRYVFQNNEANEEESYLYLKFIESDEERFDNENPGYLLSHGHIDRPSSELQIDFDVTDSHGIMSFDLLFPKFIHPTFSNDEWKALLNKNQSAILSTIQEYLIQTVSLISTYHSKEDILLGADSVVIDLRGALGREHMKGADDEGFKVGVYKANTNWPSWVYIQPTIDLAIERGAELADECNIPHEKILVINRARYYLDFPEVASGQAISLKNARQIISANRQKDRIAFLGFFLLGIPFGAFLMKIHLFEEVINFFAETFLDIMKPFF